MIFGVSLKKFERLNKSNTDKLNWFTRWQFGRTKVKKYKFKDIQDLTFSEFVDAERYLEDESFYDFCCIFVIKSLYKTIYIHELETIVKEYATQKALLIDGNEYCFNPPKYGEPPKQTMGSELRQEFVKRFGNYVVLMDLVCKGEMINYKEIEQWKVSDFFFWANYLTGQKIVEAVK